MRSACRCMRAEKSLKSRSGARRPADFGQRTQTREGLPIDAGLVGRPIFAPHVALHAQHVADLGCRHVGRHRLDGVGHRERNFVIQITIRTDRGHDVAIELQRARDRRVRCAKPSPPRGSACPTRCRAPRPKPIIRFPFSARWRSMRRTNSPSKRLVSGLNGKPYPPVAQGFRLHARGRLGGGQFGHPLLAVRTGAPVIR